MAAMKDAYLPCVGAYLSDQVIDIDDTALKKYLLEVEQLEITGVLPNLDIDLRYNVYRWKTPSRHEAIVLKAGSRRFTIELTKEVVGGWLYVIPKTRGVAEADAVEMELCRPIVTTARRLIEEVAVAIFGRFGSYGLVTNNCQDFCNRFLRGIGMGDQERMTDGVKAIVLTLVVILIVVIGVIFFKKKREQNRQDNWHHSDGWAPVH